MYIDRLTWDEKWYNPTRLLTKNRTYNMTLGARGIGKTVGLKIFLVKQYLKSGKRFLWERTTMKDAERSSLPGSKSSWVPKVLVEKLDGRLTSTKSQVKLDGEVIGYIVGLSEGDSRKGIEYAQQNVKYLVLDEFLNKHTSQDAVDNMNNFYVTVARADNPGVKQIMLSNSVERYNAYFDDLHVEPRESLNNEMWPFKEFTLYDDVAIEMARIDGVVPEAMKASAQYKIAKNNEFDDGGDELILKKPNHAKNFLNINMYDTTYGVWNDGEKYYISKKHDPSKEVILFDKPKEDQLTRFTPEGREMFSKIYLMYQYGRLRFDSKKIREMYRRYL